MSSAYSIYTREIVAARQVQPKRIATKWLRRSAAAGLTVLLIVGLVVGWRSHRQNQRRRDLLAQLWKEQNPAKLREAVRSGQLTRDDARQVFALRMQSRLESYFKLPPGPQRVQFLDKAIHERQPRRPRSDSRRPSGAPATPGPDSPAGGSPNSGTRAARMESVPPEQRAMMQQFRLDMRQRMGQLGIPTMR